MKGLATLLLFIGLLGFATPLYAPTYEEEAEGQNRFAYSRSATCLYILPIYGKI